MFAQTQTKNTFTKCLLQVKIQPSYLDNQKQLFFFLVIEYG